MQYLTREGRFVPDLVTGARTDLRHVETAQMPSWAHGDAAEFFTHAQRHERANGRYATAWRLSLPRELTEAQQVALARDFLATHVPSNPRLWVLHSPLGSDGVAQPHVHVLFSERCMDGVDRGGAPQEFRRWNTTHPARGGMRKDRWFSERGTAWALRASWCDALNASLEAAGHPQRVHPETLYKRGMERKPPPPIWVRPPGAVYEAQDVSREQVHAAAAWEQRKARLGISSAHPVSPRQVMRASHAWARAQGRGQWSPGDPSAVAQRAQKRNRMQAYKQRMAHGLETQVRILTRRLMGLAPGQERRPAVGQGLRARLRDQEEQYERTSGAGGQRSS